MHPQWSIRQKTCIIQKDADSSSDEEGSSSGDSDCSGSSSDDCSSCSGSSYSKSQPGFSSRKDSMPKGFKMGDLGGTIMQNEDMCKKELGVDSSSKLSTPNFKDQ